MALDVGRRRPRQTWRRIGDRPDLAPEVAACMAESTRTLLSHYATKSGPPKDERPQSDTERARRDRPNKNQSTSSSTTRYYELHRCGTLLAEPLWPTGNERGAAEKGKHREKKENKGFSHM